MKFSLLLSLSLLWVFPIYLNAINHPSSSVGGSLSDHAYELQECKVFADCAACNFAQMNLIKECMINGGIIVNECTSVNTKNSEKVVQHYYETCELHGFAKFELHIWFFVLFGLLALSIFSLSKYRKALEMNMYKRLSLKT